MTPTPEPGSYEARHRTPAQKRAATVAAADTRRRNAQARAIEEARQRAARLSSDRYHCPELLRTPGVPDGRYTAFALPSRVGNRLHYPDGRIVEIHQP
jgi:hypothetical protein